MLDWCAEVFNGRYVWVLSTFAATASHWDTKINFVHWWEAAAVLISLGLSLIVMVGFFRIVWRSAKEGW